MTKPSKRKWTDARIDIKNYQPNADDTFFFDNNIWIFITDPATDKDKVKADIYTAFLDKVLRSQAKICTSSLLLSEYFNVVLRRDFAFFNHDNSKNFKRDYRGTERCKETMKKTIRKIKRQILRASEKIDDHFTAIGDDELFTDMERYDFNDKYFIELCLKENLVMVSDDGDMEHDTLTILSIR